MIPITTADVAAINTAAAPTSFPARARGCNSGLAKSTTISRAVFRNSAVQTIAIVVDKTAQSRKGNPNHKPRIITVIVAIA